MEFKQGVLYIDVIYNFEFSQDFNRRLRNVLFHSHTVAVACTLLPCCFAQVSTRNISAIVLTLLITVLIILQTFVHFDMYVAIQHFVLVWAGSLTLNAVHAFPPKYCDMLHSSARHLGYWDRVGVNSTSSVQYAEYVIPEPSFRKYGVMYCVLLIQLVPSNCLETRIVGVL